MSIEMEIKYRISCPTEQLLNERSIYNLQLNEFKTMQMHTAYYDTKECILLQNNQSLRIRKEDNLSLISFKTVSSKDENLYSREQWQCEADNIADGLPALISIGAPSELLELAKFDRIHKSASPISSSTSINIQTGFDEICRVDFVRKYVSLILPDESIIELSIDEGLILANERKENFAEIEFELLAGNPTQMIEFAHVLANTYTLQKEFCSKYERAVRLLRTNK